MLKSFLNHLQGSSIVLMEDGIHDFCEIQVLFKGTEIFPLFLRG